LIGGGSGIFSLGFRSGFRSKDKFNMFAVFKDLTLSELLMHPKGTSAMMGVFLIVM
jgi:hypothetical protein